MVVIGDRLGLYKALAAGPMTSSELAAKTGTDERYVREWLSSQAAGGYVTYDDKSNQFSLSEEQAFTLAKEDSPAYLPGAFQLALGALSCSAANLPIRFAAAPAWAGTSTMTALFHGCEKFFRPGYAANLVSSWIPALDGVEGSWKRARGWPMSAAAMGASTILMAKAYPEVPVLRLRLSRPVGRAGARAAAKPG